MDFRFVSPTEETTRRLGKRLGMLVHGGDVLALCGPLGAGKTTLVQSLAEGMGLQARIRSPSFIMVQRYPGNPVLVHVDAYRLSPEDFRDLGLDEEMNNQTVVAIEWADHVPASLLTDAVVIVMRHLTDGREMVIRKSNERSAELIEGLRCVEDSGS